MITIERKVKFGSGKRKKATVAKAPTAARVPRVSKIMALAIRFDQLIRDGVVKDQAELARLGHVSRARLTQIMDLLCLAPDIQEAVLFLPGGQKGRDRVTEKLLRPISGTPSWTKQWRFWMGLAAEGPEVASPGERDDSR